MKATGAETLALGNPGCHLHLANGLKAAEAAHVKITHPVVLLAEAYRQEPAPKM